MHGGLRDWPCVLRTVVGILDGLSDGPAAQDAGNALPSTQKAPKGLKTLLIVQCRPKTAAGTADSVAERAEAYGDTEMGVVPGSRSQ